jgi:hypothetical protein
MRLPILALALVAAAPYGEAPPASAQSAYSYPWCAVTAFRGSRSCYYNSLEECRTTQSGIGGLCVQSPYYHPPAVAAPQAYPRRHRAAASPRRHGHG